MLENALQLALYSKENSVPLKFLKTVDGEIIDTTKAITDDITIFYMLYKYSIDDTIMIYYYSNKSKDDSEISSNITLFLTSINEEVKIPNYTLVMMESVKRGFDMRWDAMLETTNKRLDKLTNIKEFFDGIELKQETKESLTNSFSEDNVVKSYDYEYTNFDITNSNVKYVFNEFHVDENLYYIEYVDSDNQSLIKVHDTADKELLDIEEREKDNIYFKYKHQTDVIDIKLKINSKKLEYSYYAGKDSSEIDTILQNIFRNFNLTNQKTLFISGSFSMDIKNYKEFSFYYFIFMLINLINKEANNIIYMRETFNTRGLKKRPKYYFRDFENINHIDYVMSFTIDNVISNLYNIKYRAKNKEKQYIMEIAYLIKKYMTFYEDMSITTEGDYVSDYFVNKFYKKKFDYQERSYTRIPTKIANLRSKSQVENIFPSGGEYTKGMCECKLQPIIIDKEDVKDWESYEDINEKGRRIKHKTILFPPENSTQGPKRHYVCPTHRYPIPVLKPNTGSNSKQYPYLPCCKMTGKDEFYDFYEETRLQGKGPSISLKQSDLQTRSLPLPLQSFFKTLMDDEIEINPVEVNVNDSFIGCILYATRDYMPPQRVGDKNYKILYDTLRTYKKDYKQGVKMLRRNINQFKVHYETTKQEMFDYTNDDIINILTSDEYIDSMLFFKFFEYLFSVNIFVFTMIDDKPILEKPRYKDFHVRNIIEELPSVYLYRDPVTIKGRYSLIKSSKTLFSSNNFQNLIQDYYKTETKNDQITTYLNPYQNIIWEKIFKNYKIVSQKINEDGKCYCINIQIQNFGISVYIPPSAPLNVMNSDKIFRSSVKTLTKYFQKGEIGSQGVWYVINGMRSVFIPCKDLEQNDDICFDYTRDILKNEKNQGYSNFKIDTKNSHILIDFCIWMWRVSRLNLEEWFDTYISVSEPNTGIFTTKLLKSEYILPKYGSVPECIKWLRELNPDYDTVFRDEQVVVYPELKNSIYLYMKKVDSLTEGLVNAPSSYMSSTLETKNDYDIKKNELIFDDLPSLDDWKNDKFHNLEIFDTLDNRGIYIYRNDKGMYLVVNTESLAETLLLILYWNKSKKIVNKDLFTPQLLKGVMNRVGYKLYDTKLKIIKENKKPKLFDVIFYNTNLYSTFIKLI